MQMCFKMVSLISVVLTAGIFTSFAQETATTRAEFLIELKKSDELTKSSPYRRKTHIETGETSIGPWKAYSAAVEECIAPDRSHLTYETPPDREFIRVGKIIYSKEASGTWVRNPNDAEGIVVSPSSAPSFTGPIVEYTIVHDRDVDEKRWKVVKVVSRPQVDSTDLAQKILTYKFWFDEKGILFKFESTAFNGKNWVNRTETLTYDPEIRIEEPITK